MESKDDDKFEKNSSREEKISSHYDEISKQNRPSDPIKKPSLRKKNKYVQSIDAKPIYNVFAYNSTNFQQYDRDFPHIKPFKEPDCEEFMRKKKEKEIEDKLKKKNKKISIDPIAFKSTIDPYFDPAGSKHIMKVFCLVLCIAAAALAADSQSNPEVQIQLGKIRGSVLQTQSGKSIYAYRGIRYAQPPTGQNRTTPCRIMERNP
ncbi:hypothetical protein PV325_010068 [Microctonus aethiopoides]|nr:hypothetical protein PV325_010068 [Microctonus aethiopoides]